MQGAVINLAAPALMIDKRIRQLPHISFASDTRGDLFSRAWQFISQSSSIYVSALIVSGVGAIIVSLFQFFGFFVQLRINFMLAFLSALTVAYFLIINGPVGSPKYRLPIEPILIIWFGCALLSFWQVLKNSFIDAHDPDFLKTTDRPALDPFSTECYVAILDHECGHYS